MNTRFPVLWLMAFGILTFFGDCSFAQVPQILNYQGRVIVGTTNFDGSGLFKFALVNSNGSVTYWSNDGTSTAGSQPTNAVSLAVSKGLYSVLLGDASLANMTAIPPTVFYNADVRLRVWFNDGTTGFQLLVPDQRIASVGYAAVASAMRDTTGGATVAVGGGQFLVSAPNGSFVQGNLNLVGGNLTVTGDLAVTGMKSFKIDHPLDPANRYLVHSCVESPDMMNIYNGNVTTDATGLARITLPSYFEALNRDFRYQLTVLGQFAQAIVASKIQSNEFTIRTDKPNVEVSWQVTGIRQDASAKAHPIVVEQDKTASDRGSFPVEQRLAK